MTPKTAIDLDVLGLGYDGRALEELVL